MAISRFLQFVGKLVDAALVASACEIGVEEGGDAGLGHVAADQPRAEREHVGVIVLAGELRRQRIVDPRAAARGIAVDGDRDADARAADRDSALGVAAAIASASFRAEIGIIDALGAVGAEVA